MTPTMTRAAVADQVVCYTSARYAAEAGSPVEG